MAEVWQLIRQAVQRFYEVVAAWVTGLELDPRAWDDTTRLIALGAVLAIVVLASLRRRGRRSSQRAGWPQFLVTNGSITLLSGGPGSAPAATVGSFAATAAPRDGGKRKPAALTAPAGGHYQLKMTVNNLNSFAVQLLELAVQTSTSKMPVVADAAAVLPPHGAVDVLVDLYDLPGDRGTVALYLHNSASRPRSLRLIAPLEWEPWNQRYRVKGTAIRLEQAGAPASEQYRRKRIGQLRRQRLATGFRTATGSLWRRLSGVLEEVKANRARAAAAAAAAREARAAAARRELPISVPLAPSRSTSSDDGPPRQSRERFEWPEPAQPTSRSSAEGDGPVADEAPADKPRLDFPDEF